MILICMYENKDIFILLWIEYTLSFCDHPHFTYEISYWYEHLLLQIWV